MKPVDVVSDLSKRVQAFAVENSTTILTGVGVAGTIATSILSGRASWKSAYLVSWENHNRFNEEPSKEVLTTGESIKLVWTEYIPTIGVGGLTIASIVFANRISAKEAAALATAYGLSERAFSEYKDKVVEKIGQNKETAVRDEIAQDRVNANPAGNSNIIITGSGDVLCYDSLTDRYFESTVEEIKRAENDVNLEIVNADAVPLSRFYDRIGLKATPFSEDVGWNIDNRCEVLFSATLSTDNRPCMAIDFANWPKPNFDKVYP